VPDGDIPSRLVYKDSWPLQRDAGIEADTYSSVYDEFGVPRLWASQPLGDNSRFVNCATAWDPFGGQVTTRNPELRVHMRLYYSTVGKPLYNCETPYELIECILHAIIGHFNVLRKSNALHRDVSEGNILLVDEAVTGVDVFDELFGSNFKYLPTRCRGSLIDGDLAKRISDRKAPEAGESISGTIPFMSINLLSRWAAKNPIYHNPNDDLESGIWVAMLCGLEQSVKCGASNQEKSWLAALFSHNPRVVSGAKVEILLLDNKWMLSPPPKIHAFYGLIVKWLGLLWRRENVDDFGAEGPMSMERYLPSYREFLWEGFTWLETYDADLHRSWREFFSSQKENIPRQW